MKKTIITLLAALLLLPFAAEAQYRLVIRQADGNVTTQNIWDVDSIFFEKIEDRVLPDGAPAPTAVELGLSVKWADINLGATAETDPGWLIGWGDITGQNESRNLKWYPVLEPTGDIVGLGNDIIKKYWATDDDKWRLPTDEELQELVDGCTWEWDDTRNGFVVSGNDNSIFLPAAGSRDGSAVSGGTTVLNYWSGTLNRDDNTTARALMFNYGNGDKPTVGVLKRYMGCALRAVNGDAKVNVGISAGEAYGITYDKTSGMAIAKVRVQLTGSYSNYTSLRYGIFYSANNDLNIESGRKDAFMTNVSSDGSYEFTLEDMATDAVYYYIPYVVVNGETFYSVEGPQHLQTTSFPEPEKVDLGLSVKWASFNFGATAPEEAGRYVGWGDPTGMLESINSNDYAVGNNSMDIRGNVDYDVAANKWRKKWRMPTRAEFEELFHKTTVSMVVVSGVNCYRFTASNGNYILLPVVGLVNDTHTVSKTSWAWYWTSECESTVMSYMVNIYNTSSPSISAYSKWYRTPIRAVYEEASSQSGSGGQGGGQEEPGDDPGDDPDPGQDVPATPSDPVATIGTAVDLGLPSGTKWADRNIGAAAVTSYGDYLTWGAVNVQESYNVKDYIYYDPSGYNDMKYLGTSSDPTASYSICGSEYDAARQRWGSPWALPTRADIAELRENCTWTWTSRSDATAGIVYGYEVKGKNGKSIFLPAAGYMTQTGSSPSVYFSDSQGYYWSGDAYYGVAEEHYNTKARTLEFTEKGPSSGNVYKDRYLGLPVRAVQK